MRYLLLFIILAITLFAGYSIGKLMAGSKDTTQFTANYSFVRDIAELASLEVTGTTTLTSSNIARDGSFTDELRRMFLEKTVRLSAPFTAKYGVNLADSTMRIEHADSVLKVYLPQPRLLSYEIHLDRLEANNQKGFFRFQDDAAYSSFQKKMYTDGRAQLEKDETYLQRSRDRVCNIIQRYFAPQHVRTICIYETSNLHMPSAKP